MANVNVCLLMAFRPMSSSASMFFIVLKVLAIYAFLYIVRYKDLPLKEETHTAKALLKHTNVKMIRKSKNIR